MLGHKKTEPKLFYNLSLESLVPEDNYYRILLSILDLDFLYRRCGIYYGSTGNPSLDPTVFFRICLYGYLEGIKSDRALVKKLADSLSGRLFIGYDIDEELPWHSSISRTRALLPEEIFEELFRDVLAMCVKAGMVSGTGQSVDSTLVKANASLDSIEPKKPDMSIEEYIEQTIRENDIEKENQDEYDNDKGNDLDEVIKPESDKEDDKSKEKAKKLNEEYYSPTDPDSRIAQKPGTPVNLYYSDQISVDTKKGIITSVTAVHADRNDNEVLLDVVNKSRENMRMLGLDVQAILADGNYLSAENLKDLKQRGIIAYIAPDRRQNKKATFSRDVDFIYDAQKDLYMCKSGRELTYAGFDKDKQMEVYRAKKEDCDNCPLRSRCCGGESSRRIKHTIYKDEVEEFMEFSKTGNFKYAMRKRKSTVERAFAEAKDNHTLRRLNVRGISGAQKVFTMIAIVQNLKKLIRYGTKKLKEKEKQLLQMDKIKDILIASEDLIFKMPIYFSI